jgi:hypothetical protein
MNVLLEAAYAYGKPVPGVKQPIIHPDDVEIFSLLGLATAASLAFWALIGGVVAWTFF